MSRIIDVIAVTLLVCAASAMVTGVLALGEGRDLNAFYWTALGAVLLKAGVDVLRPARNS